MHHVDVGQPAEVGHGQVRGAAHACRGVVHLARVGFGVTDEFGGRFGRHVRVDHHHVAGVPDVGVGREVLLRVVAQFVVQGASDVVAHGRRHHHRAVGFGAGHKARADGAARTRLVLDDHGLPQRCAQFVGQCAGQDVLHTPRSKRHHDAHRFGGLGLGQVKGRQQGGAQAGADQFTALDHVVQAFSSHTVGRPGGA